MENNSGENRIVRAIRLALLSSAVLLAAWLLPPVVHSYRHLCPVKSDGVAEAGAVPSFARQTGMACSMCHTVWPELTPYGRRFKLNGYTLTTKPADVSDYLVTDSTQTTVRNVVLSYVSPLSAIVTSNYVQYARAVPSPTAKTPGSTYNTTDLTIPGSFTLMYAGRIADNIGTFTQIGWTNSTNLFSMAPSELLRYADHTEDRNVVWGVSLNNSLAKMDLWDSPVHGFTHNAYGGSGGFAGGTGGIGLKAPKTGGPGGDGVAAFSMIGDALYVEAGAAHSDALGHGTLLNGADDAGQDSGWNPQLRVAYEWDWDKSSLMIGGQASHTDVYGPTAALNSAQSPTIANQFADFSADWQYQYIADQHLWSTSGAITTERQSLNPQYVVTTAGGNAPVGTAAYSNSIDYMRQVNLNAMYWYRRRYGATVSWIDNNGTHDTLQYGGNGTPHNQYWTFEADYMPFLNVRIFAQYNAYTVVSGKESPFYQLNGSSGVNGKASDNNYASFGVQYDF